jgi:hypothetical protein
MGMCCGYPKSSPPAKLLEAIVDVSKGGPPISSHIARKVVQHFHLAGPSLSRAEELSPREREVLDLLAGGYIYKEIGDKLGISPERAGRIAAAKRGRGPGASWASFQLHFKLLRLDPCLAFQKRDFSCWLLLLAHRGSSPRYVEPKQHSHLLAKRQPGTGSTVTTS